jgi:hypothetical protein
LCELKETLQGFFITKKMNGYDLSRNWFNFRYENRDKVRAIHSELYLYIVDLWNRLGQKDSFGLPTNVTMECLGVGSYNTFKNALQDLVDFGFIKVVKDSKNQHYSKLVALSKCDKATVKALDKATIKATDEATDEAGDKPTDEPTDEPTDTIIKQGTKNNEQGKKNKEKKENNIRERKLKFASTLKPFLEIYGKDMLNDFYQYWTEPNKSNTKFRQELEKTWNLERRLLTWSNNDSKFNKGKKPNVEKWTDPSEVYLCTDWIRRIPKPPSPLDLEACQLFSDRWKISHLRTYQYEQEGWSNVIHDYEP